MDPCIAKSSASIALVMQDKLFSSTRKVSGLILGLRPANERRRYFVTTSLIGWAQA